MHAFGGASTVLFSSAVFGSNLSVCQLKMFTPGPKLLQHPDKAKFSILCPVDTDFVPV